MGLISKFTIAAVLVAGGVPVAAMSQTQPLYMTGALMPSTVAFNAYKHQMLSLREDAVALKNADGGALTDEHRQQLQRRIDHIEYIYHRRLERDHPPR